jgi:hypothetical protein
MSVIATAEQANEHDGKQEHVRNKRGDYCHLGNLDVERHAEAVRNFRCIAELSEELERKL